jgi:hypothetical protein
LAGHHRLDLAHAVPGQPRHQDQSPVTPSIRSRMMSAWPLWRAYSSIMCT